VRSAALASSAVPGVYKPQPLLVKTLDGQIKKLPGLYSDGSLENDLPSQQLSELFNINHFIVSQVSIKEVEVDVVSIVLSIGVL
jgi:TAG lipase / steryl ester hydrolase / phospholipase A2 / LPA acyltransferase